MAGTGVDELHASAAGAGAAQVARDAQIMELRARVSELDELRRQHQALLALRNEQLPTPRAAGAGIWPWLAAALAVVMPVAWGLGWRSGRVAGADDGGVPADASGPMPTTGLELAAPASPAWHPAVRQTTSVTADA